MERQGRGINLDVVLCSLKNRPFFNRKPDNTDDNNTHTHTHTWITDIYRNSVMAGKHVCRKGTIFGVLGVLKC